MATNVVPSTTIWVQAAPRAGSTNWGRKARKNSAVFGLSTFTTTPCRKMRESRSGSTAEGTSSSPCVKSRCRPSQIRYAAPNHFTMLKAAAEDASSAESPTAAKAM
jgi:hypothetical protein